MDKPKQKRQKKSHINTDNLPSTEEMADQLSGNKQAALLALQDMRIAMRHVAGGQALTDAYSAETGASGRNCSRWKNKPSAQFWLEAVSLAKDATDEAMASTIEGSMLAIIADPSSQKRDVIAAASLLAKVRGLDKLKVEVQKSDDDLLFEQILKNCQVKSFNQPNIINV